jgi:hypothetical protein
MTRRRSGSQPTLAPARAALTARILREYEQSKVGHASLGVCGRGPATRWGVCQVGALGFAQRNVWW